MQYRSSQANLSYSKQHESTQLEKNAIKAYLGLSNTSAAIDSKHISLKHDFLKQYQV